MAAVHRQVTTEDIENNMRNNNNIITGEKRVSFGQTIIVESTNHEMKFEKDVKTKNTVNARVSDVVEENTSFQITVRPQYNEACEPGSRVSYCQILGGRRNEPGEIKNATHVSCLNKGQFFVVDMLSNKLLLFLEDWSVIREYEADDMLEPWAMAILGAGNMAVTCRRSKSVAVMDIGDGHLKQSFGLTFFKSPCGIASVSDTSVVVTDDVTNKVSVHEVDSGKIVTYVGKGQSFKNPRYVTVSKNSNIIVSDTGNHSIKIFDSNGNFIRQFGKYGSGNGSLKFPHGVCTDSFDNIYVADHFNNRVSVFDKDGRFCSHIVSSSHGLQHPQGVTLTPDLRLLVSTGDLKATHVLIYSIDIRQTLTDSVCHS